MSDNKDDAYGIKPDPDKNAQDGGNDDGFSFVQEKIKPKTKKRIKKALSVAGLALLAGLMFGLAARVSFMLSETPVAKVLGIEGEKNIAAVSPPVNNRSEVTFPTNTLTKIPTKMPTKTPTKAVTQTPTPVPTMTEMPTDEPSKEQEETGGAVTESVSPSPIQDVEFPTKEADISSAPVPDSSAQPDDTQGGATGEQPDADEHTAGDIDLLEGYLGMVTQMRGVAAKAQESLVRVYSVTTGVNWMDESIETRQELTGVLMGNNGVELLVLADYNMVSGADRLEAELPDGKTYDAALYSFDSDSNMAVISVEMENLPAELLESIKYMQLGDSQELSCGEPVIAIGRPNGYYGAMEFGYVSHTGIYGYILDGCMDEFMTDFAFSTNGDGVVTDISGSLVGFIPFSGGDDAPKNRIVGINSLKSLILKLLNGSDVPLFGIRSEDIPSDILENMGIENGIYVNEVIAASPAGKAGIKKGDVILKIGGDSITGVSQFYEMLLKTDTGTRVEVQIYRASRPDDPYSVENVIIEKK